MNPNMKNSNLTPWIKIGIWNQQPERP